MWMARNFWYFFLVPGLAMLIGAAVVGARVVSFGRSAEHAEGTVTQNRYTTDSDGNGTYHPQVEFVGSDGQKHTFVSHMGTSPASFKIGERVPVLYNGDQPEDASIDAFTHQWFSTIMLAGLGLVFGLVGGIPLLVRARNTKQAEWLKLNGRPVQADYTGAPLRTNYEVNGRSPYRISAQWKNPSTNQIHVFMSENLWFDPAPYIASKTLTVLIDPQNPKRYWIDTTFLPKLAR